MFFFNDTATTEIYTLSLHDALPISITIDKVRVRPGDLIFGDADGVCVIPHEAEGEILNRALAKTQLERNARRSEEHTSELQSPCKIECRLLLEKKTLVSLTHGPVRY